MKKSAVDKVGIEITRFISAVKEMQKESTVVVDGKDQKHYSTGMYTGAVKRASMDLSRSLADLRRP